MLHGDRQCAEIFRSRTDTLRRKLREVAEMVYIDAPHERPLEAGQMAPTRTWWRDGRSGAGAGDGDGTADVEASLAAVAAAWEAQGPFDGVLGLVPVFVVMKKDIP